VQAPNVLWNSASGKVMLVDFERSEILRRVPALQEVSPNKRRRLHLSKAELCGYVCTGCSFTISDPAQKADWWPSKCFDGERSSVLVTKRS
jgi:hypothetical protein